VDNSNRSCPTLLQEQNSSHMFQTPVKPRCTYADDVEFDTVLFEPAGHDSDNEGWFYNSDYKCNFSFVRHFSPCNSDYIILISNILALCNRSSML